MSEREYLERLTRNFSLTPYQSYMLAQNFHKYNLRRLVKRGEILYAPYKCELSRSFRDAIEKIFFGPRADLIGTDKILVFDRRGIKLRRDGTYM